MDRVLNSHTTWYTEHRKTLPFVLYMSHGVRYLWMHGMVLGGEERWANASD